VKHRECYWFGPDCKHGHLVGCPVTEFALDPNDPWAEKTNPRAAPTALPSAYEKTQPIPYKPVWTIDLGT
jgi:hypothetical protein